MVFRDLAERHNEKWSDTMNILAETIADTCDVSFDSALDSINRAHRSGAKSKASPRPIYANFDE